MGMARVVIIGASKGIGLETTRQALEAGHMVRAFARSAADISISDPKLEKVRGNALRSNDVTAAVKGTNAVIQALGVGLGDLFGPVHLFSDATPSQWRNGNISRADVADFLVRPIEDRAYVR